MNPTPALSLPYELTAQIFLLTLPRSRRVEPHSRRAPLNLASVCRHWRDVALATPELWASINLHFEQRVSYEGVSDLFALADNHPISSPAESHSSTINNLVGLWFTRSRNYPLSITLRCSKGHQALPEGLVKTLATHASHWGRVQLRIGLADFDAFNGIPGPFPLLQALEVDVDSFSVVRRETNLRLRALRDHQAPNLRCLMVRNGYDDEQVFRGDLLDLLPAGMSALRLDFYLDTGIKSLAILREIARRFPGLRALEAFHYLQSWDVEGYLDGTEMPPLALALDTAIVFTDEPRYFPLLDNPALKHLEVGSAGLGVLSTFLVTATCRLTLTSLKLWLYAESSMVRVCLELLPALAVLELSLWGDGSGALTAKRLEDLQARSTTATAPAGVSVSLLPNLRSLRVISGVSIRAPAVIYPAFADLLLHRAVVGQPLATAELKLWSEHSDIERGIKPPPAETLGILEDLVRGGTGMQVYVVTPTYRWPWSFDQDVYDPLCDDAEWDLLGYVPQTRSWLFSAFDPHFTG
ncbi:C3H1-type domain-containing protein [Mycena kentingensis (nom. inval.)]|nr:C3H1-type domain-containing protein [Mycena kentingensis (nom. inval.)]